MKKIRLFCIVILMIAIQVSSVYAIDNKEYKQYNRNNSKLSTDKVIEVKSDSLGGVWFATYGGGVVNIDKDGNWTVYRKDIFSLNNNYANCIDIDMEGNKFFGTNEGVSSLTKNNSWNNYYVNSNKIYAEYIDCLKSDNKGGIWHGVRSYGAYYKNSLGEWLIYNADNSSLPSNNVKAMDIDENGGVWFGTHPEYNQLGGIAYLSKDNKWTVYNSNNSKLPSNRVNDIYVAKDGSAWIGTVNGLAKYSNNNWTLYKNNSLLEYDVRAISEDKDGNIYAATWGHGLLMINKSGKLTIYKEANSPIANNYIYDIEFDTSNNLWVTTNEGITLIKDKIKDISQDKNITVYVNNVYIYFDSKPIIKDNRTLVPMRQIFEALGQDVEWVESERKIVSTGTKNIELIIGEKAGYINGDASVLDVAPQIANDRTLVPLRWISEALDLSVHWNPNTYRIDIYK